jgi:formylglycine-generating enzyme required for sulfatase activity/Ethanolamine utilization protein EutJ (predicted chaperonin)
MNTISIDFGTSNTSAAWLDPDTGKPEPIRFIDNGMEKLPSLVYYPTNGDAVVGEPALTLLTQLNKYSKEKRFEIQAAIVSSLKRRLMANGLHVVAGGPPVRHAEIVGEIFKKIKIEVEVNYLNSTPVEKVILSHPVIISQTNKGVLKEAAQLAGFKTIKFIEEPVAAAMGFVHSNQHVGQGILVYDFGGSTFDIAFILQDGKERFHIPLPVYGDESCGGDDIDLVLYDHWETLIEKGHISPVCNNPLELDMGLLFQCKKQKETLSTRKRKKFLVSLPPPKSLQITRTIDRHTLNRLMSPVIDRTIQKTQVMLNRIKQSGYKLDTVVLVGGSSRIPLVMERLEKVLPVEPLKPMQTDTSVCIGALMAAKPLCIDTPSTSKKVPVQHVTEKCKIDAKMAKNVSQSKDIWQEPLTAMKMAWVPQGSFCMGSDPSEKEREEDEGPLHIVNISGFWIGQYPVTQAEWQEIMGSNPSVFKNGDNYPVEYISWKDAYVFIQKLNKYHENKYRFALPTEAQWEYACRAGTTTPFYFGDNLSTDQANYNGNLPYKDGPLGIYRETTTPVGTFSANGFGIFDMHGNVWEWCRDRYEGQYSLGKVNDPKGPSSGVSRVIRGGCWNDGAWICRSAYRNLSTPSSRHSYTGFRITMRPM